MGHSGVAAQTGVLRLLHSPLSTVSVGGLIWKKTFRHSVSHAYIFPSMTIMHSSSSGRSPAWNDLQRGLHFDFISMHPLTSKSDHTFAYVFIVKDDLSEFVEFIASSSPDHSVVASGLMDWYKRFGLPQYLVSDQGCHFQDQSSKELNQILQKNHHFVTIHSPWANGTAEIVCRHLQSTMTSLISEFEMQP